MNALAIDPRDANILYAGAAEGGVWKTSNGGASWTPLTDTQLVRKLASGKLRGTLSIGSLAVNPVTPDIVYAGTGDPNVACCFVGSGLGVFRSPDGGATWAATGLNANQTGCQNGAIGQGVVNRMIVIPGRPAVVFADTDMGLFSYKEDGRDCWTKLTLGLPVSGNATRAHYMSRSRAKAYSNRQTLPGSSGKRSAAVSPPPALAE
jgi:hypothetical protein